MELNTEPIQNPSENQPTKITIIFPTNAYFMSGIRDFTLDAIKNMSGFTDQWAFRFQSVVDELCNNAIEHGSSAGKDITLWFSITKNYKIEVAVEDTGTGPEPKTAEQLNKLLAEKRAMDPTQLLTIRGRGLSHIVAPLTDEIHFEDLESGGVRTRVIKYFNNQDNI